MHKLPSKDFISRRNVLISTVLLSSFPTAIISQELNQYPSKIITLLVPYPAGGSSDIIARYLQPHLSSELNKAIIIQNLGGAGGGIGLNNVLNSKNDGYKLASASSMELIITPLTYEAIKFKSEDFKIVAMISKTDMILTARSNLPINTIDDLINYAKKRELTIGNIGQGSYYHLVAEKFSQLSNLKFSHISYKGFAAIVQDLLTGQIDLSFLPIGGSVNMINSGKIKALGVASKDKNPSFPNVPALAQEKRFQDLQFNLWSSIAVHKDTPNEIQEVLNKAIYQAIKNPDFIKNVEADGSEVLKTKSLEELEKIYKSEILRFQSIAKDIGIKIQ